MDFKEAEVGGLLFEFSDGRYLRLTPEGTDFTEEPYYALIMHPTITASSRPTLILFEVTDDPYSETVIWVGLVDCDLVQQLILLAPLDSIVGHEPNTDGLGRAPWPSRSACRSG